MKIRQSASDLLLKIEGPLKQHFFLGPGHERFIAPLEVLVQTTHDTLKPAAEGFKANLGAVLLAAQIPFHLCFLAVEQRTLSHYVAAERIRALDLDDAIAAAGDPAYYQSEEYRKKSQDKEHLRKEQEREARAVEIALQKFDREQLTPEAYDRATGQAFEDLYNLLGRGDISIAAKELLRQSVVLTWVALEALAGDLFVLALNRVPGLASGLLKNEQTKKRFQLRDLLRVIDEYGFDLSSKMGEILISQCRLDDLETIKAVFDSLLPRNNRVRDALSQPDLWRLYQRRNLIVHRGGIVDKLFLEKTGEQLPIGAKLAVNSDDLSRFLRIVRDAGVEMTSGVANLLA